MKSVYWVQIQHPSLKKMYDAYDWPYALNIKKPHQNMIMFMRFGAVLTIEMAGKVYFVLAFPFGWISGSRFSNIHK